MLGAILGAVGSLGSALLGHSGASAQNAANARQAQLNRDFQERMSSTAYQRAVKDMQSAGLNPALAYQQGGASAPTGSTAHMENTLSQAAGSAQRAATVAQELQNMRDTGRSIRAQASKSEAEANQIRLESAARLVEVQERGALANASANNIRQLFPALYREHTARGELSEAQWKLLMQTLPLHVANMRAVGARETASARNLNASALLSELLAPGARNRAAAESSWWKRVISPYLNDAGSITRLVPKILLKTR